MKDMEEHEDDFVPSLGMEYETLDEAWLDWSVYGGRNGFRVRKGKGNKTKKDDANTSKVFFCSCEGKREIDKQDHLMKKPRAETRTGCQARLLLKLDRGTNKYKVAEFVKEHNHPLQPPEACYLLASERKVSEIACFDIQVAASFGIKPKDAYGLHSMQHGGIRGLGYTYVDHKNCLRDQRKQAMQHGATITMMKYFANRSMEDLSFKHFEDIFDEGEISNVVWMDAMMIEYYARFGDVVVFDTTFGTNNEKWALGTFVGFNHLKEIVVFGAGLMCNHKKESFQWVFIKFLEAHGGKKPITIFTDQEAAIGSALEIIMPDMRHGLCTWHINQNRLRHLKMKKDDESKEVTSKYEEEKEFDDAFSFLMGKVNGEGKDWLEFIYKSKEKLLEQKREKEIKSEYEMRRKLPRLKSKMPILRGASDLYTPNVFELFQAEVELSMEAHIECLEGNMYTVGSSKEAIIVEARRGGGETLDLRRRTETLA
ncbi:hypothetical protein LUZ61_006712 [Rhynchospora tenuis]|uniref:Protein FAR1-RELATED SEQUENCE n=1 Tax=Rhynchospora tenuis TaxID=198213 RepID=A0AAD5ZRZ8_9POAL|nr:hypothetical protein LUZ61_006712 [Rhynchospora tenuis]